MTEEESDAHVVGVIFAQHYSMKKDRELYRDRADVTIHKELNQIQDHTTYEPVIKSTLTPKQRHEALESLLFITEKRNGYVNARNVADGSKQHITTLQRSEGRYACS